MRLDATMELIWIDLTCSIGRLSFTSCTTDPSASLARNLRPNPKPDVDVKDGVVVTAISKYGN